MTLGEKINEVMKEVRSIYKGGEIKMNERSSYSVVTWDGVVGPIHDAFAKHGIIVEANMLNPKVERIETTSEYQGKVTIKQSWMASCTAAIRFKNSAKADDSFECQAFAYAFDTGDKAMGKAYTMACKMIMLKTLLLESTDEEEARPTEEGTKYSERSVPRPVQQSGYSEAPRQAQVQAKAEAPKTSPTSQPTSPQEPQRPLNHAPTGKSQLSEAQEKRLWAMSKALGWSKEDVFTGLRQQFNKGNTWDLTREEYTIFTSKMQVEIDKKKRQDDEIPF